MTIYTTTMLRTQADYNAPDGSEIRLLPQVRGAGLADCTLPPGQTTKAVRHRTVDEIWYVLQGAGQVWRKLGDEESVVDVAPGICLTIPVTTHFQFRNTSTEPLTILIVTSPVWSGADEAVAVPDHW